MITIGECLKRMHAGEVFSLKVVSYDRKRPDKCGLVHEYAEAILMWATAPAGSPAQMAKGERPLTDLERSMLQGAAEHIERKPNHADHYTRNIRLLLSGQPTESVVKIHPPLIIQFNGQPTCP